MRALPLVLAILIPATAWSNGGVSRTVFYGEGAGSLRPRHESAVRLVSEAIEITLSGGRSANPSEWRYKVHAEYRLANRGAPVHALYAVPVFVPSLRSEIWWGTSDQTVLSSAEGVARTITIALNGPAVGCTFHPEPPRDVVPEDLRVLGTTLGTTAGAQFAGFCSVPLEIPRGNRIDLVLEYGGGLFGQDHTPPAAKDCDVDPQQAVPCEPKESQEKCERRRQAWRAGLDCAPKATQQGAALYYSLGAASSWAGPAERVSVSVTLDGFGFDASSSSGVPSDAATAGGKLSWAWKKPDLAFKEFVVGLKPKSAVQGGIRAPQEEQDQRCRLDPRGIKARSSSHIASQEPYSFEPEKALDGRAETSWCVNTKTHGVGEWIELELPVDPARPAVPEALYIIPGLAATQSIWEANGRLSRILVGPCGSKGTSIPLSVADDYLDAMVEVKGAAKVLGDLFKAGETKACLRLEIAEVLPGKKYQDTCVSEIALSLRCR